MKTFKKIVKTVLAIVCFTSIILAGAENLDGSCNLAGAENLDGSCNLAWTLTWIAVAYVSGRQYGKLDKSCNR